MNLATTNSLSNESIDQTNPYAEVPINKSDLCLLQQSLKWENGIWSDLEQLTIRKKILHCCVRKEAHWHMARDMESKTKIINLPKLLLSSILGTSLVAGAGTGGATNEVIGILNAVLSVILPF